MSKVTEETKKDKALKKTAKTTAPKAKAVIKERIKYVDKIIYVDKVIEREIIKHVDKVVPVEVEMPIISRCIICKEIPLLNCHYNSEFEIRCVNCNTKVAFRSTPHTKSMFTVLYTAINSWNKLGSHLVEKEEVSNE